MTGTQIAEFITQNISLAIVAIGAIVIGVQRLVSFFKKPSNEKIAELKAWLFGAVAAAEADLGSETGKLKLAAVYDNFRLTFPSLADKITIDQFNGYVNDILQELKTYADSHDNVKKYLEGNVG